jgi:hypothetical protein
MPEVATHATIIQRLAKTAQDGSDNGAKEIRKFLTDPDLVSKWSTYDSPGGLQSRYGAIGPDMFFAVLDYGPRIQEFDDMVVKLDGTFRAGR